MTNDSILTRMYREHRALFSGSSIYQPEPEQPEPRNLYAGSPAYQGLGSYQNRPAPVDTRSPMAQAYNAEHSPWERAARQAAEDEAEQGHQELRQFLEARTSGTGVGLGGHATPQQRAAALGSRGFGSGREVANNGHVTATPISDGRPASMAEVNAVMRQREAELGGHQPQRQAVSQLRSTGTGWTAR